MEVPTSQLLTEYLINTRDNSDANRARGKARMDHHYTFLLSQANNHVTERKMYGNLKGNQRSYYLPKNYLPNGMKIVRVYVNDRWQILEPVLPAEHWHEFTKDLTFTEEPTHYTVINEQGRPYLEIDGIPSLDADENLEITYLGYQDPLVFPDDYSVGTVNITHDTPYVNGTGTTFTEEMIGRFIKVTGGKAWYEITSFGSTILLSLAHNFSEPTTETIGYTIAEVPRLPHEFHYTPMYGAVYDYYLPKNAAKGRDYKELFDRDTILLQRRYQNKTQGSVKPGMPVNRGQSRVPYTYPNSTITRL